MKLRCLDLPIPVIFFTILLNSLGFGILIPVIPLLLANPKSQYFMLPSGFTLAQGYIIFGFLVASFSVMQFIATPILGQLSDKFGRKRILAVSLAGTCISFVMFAVGIIIKNIPLLFISRAFDGLTGGNVSVAQAVVADVTPPDQRAKTFGLIGSAFGIGFILGPFLGGILSEKKLVGWFNAATPFWFAAILSFIDVCIILVCLAETFKTEKNKKIIWSQSIKNIAKALQYEKLKSDLYLFIFISKRIYFLYHILQCFSYYKICFYTKQYRQFLCISWNLASADSGNSHPSRSQQIQRIQSVESYAYTYRCFCFCISSAAGMVGTFDCGAVFCRSEWTVSGKFNKLSQQVCKQGKPGRNTWCFRKCPGAGTGNTCNAFRFYCRSADPFLACNSGSNNPDFMRNNLCCFLPAWS